MHCIAMHAELIIISLLHLNRPTSSVKKTNVNVYDGPELEK